VVSPDLGRRRRGILQIGNLKNVLRGSRPVATIWVLEDPGSNSETGLGALRIRPTSVPTTRRQHITVSWTVDGGRAAGGELEESSSGLWRNGLLPGGFRAWRVGRPPVGNSEETWWVTGEGGLCDWGFNAHDRTKSTRDAVFTQLHSQFDTNSFD
jgi:hypothetical protein